MVQYLEIFIDKEYPRFIDKYLETRTLKRLKHVIGDYSPIVF